MRRAGSAASKLGVVGAASAPDGDVRSSRCAPSSAAVGVDEDPVTGSLNAGLAQWLIGAGLAPERYVAAQGTRARPRRPRRIVRATIGGDTVWVGGDVERDTASTATVRL